jgi:hypothetical protein
MAWSPARNNKVLIVCFRTRFADFSLEMLPNGRINSFATAIAE